MGLSHVLERAFYRAIGEPPPAEDFGIKRERVLEAIINLSGERGLQRVKEFATAAGMGAVGAMGIGADTCLLATATGSICPYGAIRMPTGEVYYHPYRDVEDWWCGGVSRNGVQDQARRLLRLLNQ